MSFDSPLPPYNASDPSATFLNSSCLDLLLIELVPMAYRLANELQPEGGPGAAAAAAAQARAETEKAASGSVGAGAQRKLDEDEERDAVFYRLEMLGYRVGQGLVER